MSKHYRFTTQITSLILLFAVVFLWISLSSGSGKGLAAGDQQGLVKEDSTPSPQPVDTLASMPEVSPTRKNTINFSSTVTSTIVPSPTPEFWTKLIIGQSVEGRPLEVYRFGNGEQHYLIIAGVHGGYEWNTIALADELIDAIQIEPALIPDEATLFILRAFNIDGYEKDQGYDGRANANQVDLNRNWDANWQKRWAGTQCWGHRIITAGKEPASEPETQALMSFILENEIKAVVNYHSAALGIFPGGWPNDARSMELAESIAMVSPYAYPPIDIDCQYTGQFIDWASAQGIAAVDVELTDHTHTDFDINLGILKVFLNW